MDAMTRELKTLSIIDGLLERIEEQTLLGDAELLSDLSNTLYNVAVAVTYLPSPSLPCTCES